jgi:hypothetical protein
MLERIESFFTLRIKVPGDSFLHEPS